MAPDEIGCMLCDNQITFAKSDEKNILIHLNDEHEVMTNAQEMMLSLFFLEAEEVTEIVRNMESRRRQFCNKDAVSTISEHKRSKIGESKNKSLETVK